MAEQEKNVDENKRNDEQKDLMAKLEATGYKYEDDDRYKGMIKDLQSERTSRHLADEELARLREENEMLSEEIAGKEKTSTSEGFMEGKSDDEYLTVADAKQLLKNSVETAGKADKKQQQIQLQQRMLESEETAKDKYSVEKVGEGLDYMSVLEGFKRVAAKNPAYKQVMLNSRNPAEEAYRIGLIDPEISARATASNNSKVLAKMKSGGGGLPKGNAGSGGGGLDNMGIEELLGVDESEIMKSIRDDEAK